MFWQEPLNHSLFQRPLTIPLGGTPFLPGHTQLAAFFCLESSHGTNRMPH